MNFSVSAQRALNLLITYRERTLRLVCFLFDEFFLHVTSTNHAHIFFGILQMYVFRFQYTFSGSTFIGFRCTHGIFHTKLVRTEVRYEERIFYVFENKGKLRYDKYYIYVQKTFVVRSTHTLRICILCTY